MKTQQQIDEKIRESRKLKTPLLQLAMHNALNNSWNNNKPFISISNAGLHKIESIMFLRNRQHNGFLQLVKALK